MGLGVNLIPRNRLRWMPRHLRLAHEYCFFLHDEGVRALRDYEAAKAHHVTITFGDDAEATRFMKHGRSDEPIAAMRAAGYDAEARRVILNQITMAMVADCLHHVYEALRCLEKRKVVVAANLLRKPLTDSLLYLSWMLGDEDGFYQAFSTNSPNGITAKLLKNRREHILSQALAMTRVATVLDAGFIDSTLFDRSNPHGLQRMFQHAVHLVTVERVELRTSPENFNFIFSDLADDGNYDAIYDVLPHILLYLSHVMIGLFERIRAPEGGSMQAFETRSILGLYLVEGGEGGRTALDILGRMPALHCLSCGSRIGITRFNAGCMVLAERVRCTSCRVVQPFPFSWMFEPADDEQEAVEEGT